MLFVISGSIFLSRNQDNGRIGNEDVFCLACLESHYYKTKTFDFKTPPNWSNYNQLVYIPADLGISERSLLIKILHTFASTVNNDKTKNNSLAPLAAQFFSTWGKFRPQIKLRLPYFATFENNQPKWPTPPIPSYFGSVLSWRTDNSPFALLLLSPVQTEMDVTLSLAHALFRLFDPFIKTDRFPKTPLLANYWAEYRALLLELHLWKLFSILVEPNKISQYRFAEYKRLEQFLDNKDYYSIYIWMVNHKNDFFHTTHTDVWLAQPTFKNKTPLELVKNITPPATEGSSNIFSDLFPQANQTLGAFKWTQFFSKDSPYDGLLIGVDIKQEASPSTELILKLNQEMIAYIKQQNPNYHNDITKQVFEEFVNSIGIEAISLPQNLADEMNLDIKGDF